ncbi:hypothetical protein ABZ752_32985 [Streptomyces roseifaciens]
MPAERTASPTPFNTNSNPAPGRPGASCFLEEFAVPTYEARPRFTTDLDHLTPEQRRTFRSVVTPRQRPRPSHRPLPREPAHQTSPLRAGRL